MKNKIKNMMKRDPPHNRTQGSHQAAGAKAKSPRDKSKSPRRDASKSPKDRSPKDRKPRSEKCDSSEYEEVEIEVEEKVKGPKKVVEEERGFGKKAAGFISFGVWGKAEKREVEEVKVRKVKKKVL